ncbi:MAG: STAS domain-containing protein [Chloroflexi bacterium]|nr:STAS domain-containing protein [Chloroflexota bacterium]
MNINSEKTTSDIMIIKLDDRVDTFSAPNLRAHFSKLLAQGRANFIVDLSDATFLDSAGLAALVKLLKDSREKGGNVKIILPENKSVRRIFSLTKFDRVFDIQLTVPMAVGAF